MQNKIIAENPNLVDFIEQMASQYPPEVHQAIFEAICGTLVLLERQTKSDV